MQETVAGYAKICSCEDIVARSSFYQVKAGHRSRGVRKRALRRSRCRENANKVEEDVSNALIVMLREATDETKRKVSIIGMELKTTLNRVSIHIEMKLQATIFCIRTELEPDGSEALWNGATCSVILLDRVAEVCCILLGMDSSMVNFEADIAVDESAQTVGLVPE